MTRFYAQNNIPQSARFRNFKAFYVNHTVRELRSEKFRGFELMRSFAQHTVPEFVCVQFRGFELTRSSAQRTASCIVRFGNFKALYVKYTIRGL